MTTRILLQLFFFLLPFIAYGVFRWSTRNVRDWKKSWPIQALFVIGLLLGLVAWLVAIALQPEQKRDVCIEPAHFKNGVLSPAREVACEQNVSDSGQPRGQKDIPPARGFTDGRREVLVPVESEPATPPAERAAPGDLQVDTDSEPSGEGGTPQ